MEIKYKLKCCPKCRQIKENPNSTYCSKCSREYNKYYRSRKTKAYLYQNLKRKANRPKHLTELINSISEFIDKIVNNGYYVDLYDINQIIEFYQITARRENEFDELPFGDQVMKMWYRINEFLHKQRQEQVDQ